ncbi:hypothetical protein AM493_16295 [Flavobacterium akiainvivens]|uniref:Uncharacterized protein n=1 Tax=Flavobacterium akiainvivens TaxID=1202724 RepID=A0A0M8MKJ2_9FLAO|nr:hypothetical protein [Flavobacterium akiainvivens]KOS07428.1 hypothetical protein AM493_16295 [Flavobacterium akiainvivens]SFQ48040.1 hypothetical protein SAMN05444144_105240 [Flavobacterium akiainvivens]
MSSVLKTLLFITVAANFSGCRDNHHERTIAKQPVGNDTVIIKQTGGDYLAGGTLVFRQTKDSLHKVYMDSYAYDEAHILGLNSKQDSLKIKFVVSQNSPLPQDTLKIGRVDTLSIPWTTYIESWKRDE